MNRKERRKIESQARKAGNKDLEDKMKLYSKLSDKCRVCESKLDKSDLKMLSEWMVVVRQEENRVNLYCPKCWKNAVETIENLKMQSQEDLQK